MSQATHPPSKDPFDAWLELVVLILVAPLVGLIGGTWRFIQRAIRRFIDARRHHDSSGHRSSP